MYKLYTRIKRFSTPIITTLMVGFVGLSNIKENRSLGYNLSDDVPLSMGLTNDGKDPLEELRLMLRFDGKMSPGRVEFTPDYENDDRKSYQLIQNHGPDDDGWTGYTLEGGLLPGDGGSLRLAGITNSAAFKEIRANTYGLRVPVHKINPVQNFMRGAVKYLFYMFAGLLVLQNIFRLKKLEKLTTIAIVVFFLMWAIFLLMSRFI